MGVNKQMLFFICLAFLRAPELPPHHNSLPWLTTLPPLPECRVPALYSPITLPTFFCALVIFMLAAPLIPNYATLGRFRRKGCDHFPDMLDPYIPTTASLANVKQNASALSGDGRPRFLISSFPSIWIFPLDVNE